MPTVHKTGQALFLGLELATDQLRATIVDESLELVGVECVDFDTEVSEYQTQGGIFTNPGEAYTTPVEMWIKGLDLLLEKLSRNHDLTRIKSVGGSAQHALVWWKSTAVPSLSTLDPHVSLQNHFPVHLFSLPHVPTASDTSSHTHALAIEGLLGGPEHMASRVGTCASSSLVAAQLLRVRESWPQEVWARTGRVQLASAFLGSLIAGKWMPMGEAEACSTGMWVHGANTNSTNPGQPSGSGYWDEGILDIIGGSREEGRRVRGWLGDVDTSGGGRRAGNISRYLVERYGFEPDTIVSPFTSDSLSSYLSLLPSSNDAVLSFGPMDTLMTPAQHYIPTRLYNLIPHPAQDAGEKRKYIAVLTSRNADIPRAYVRDKYTKSWSAFDRLVAIVPPGGSIGQNTAVRFETGVRVPEFRDLRANPRCLVESQILAFRVKWARMYATGVLGTPRKPTASSSPAPQTLSAVTLSNLGLPFDPYDAAPLPFRILATGSAANFPSVVNVVGDVFNAPVFVPSSQVEAAQVEPYRNAPARGFPSRAAIGAAYVARWVWARDREGGSMGLVGFEEEGRRVLGKRWVATNGLALRTNMNGPVSTSNGTSTPGTIGSSSSSYNLAGTGLGSVGMSRSGLGLATVFVEEEEDEELEREKREREQQERAAAVGQASNVGVIGGNQYLGSGAIGGDPYALRSRTQTASTADSLGTISSPGLSAPSTAFTTPDSNLLSAGSFAGSNGLNNTLASPTPLTPIVALPTADVEAQIGLAKVADSDVDAFMTYAAIVPEFVRLEQMLIKEGRPKGPVPVNFGIVVFPGFQALDAFGPLDALNTLSHIFPMNLAILSETLELVSTKNPMGNPLGSDFGQSISPTHTFASPPPLDVLLVPGGLGAMLPSVQTTIDFVGKIYPSLKYLITVCNGASIPARAGVFDGKKATTAKVSYLSEIAMRKEVKWVAHARWVVDGNIWTSSGVTAGLDAIFAFIADVYGEEAAEKVSNVMEYERHQDPKWDPFAELYGLPLDKA
ncbi:hypothetical protein H0H92_010162 [Tricholoma furcatifolium]|nr:hypothetical protein H0H92_010162 [Tricholoma furcatifolium]